MSDGSSKIRFLAEGDPKPEPKPKKKSGLRRNLSTPENRAFWAAADEADRIIKTWPQWKQDYAKSMQEDWESRQSRYREDD